MRRIAPDKEDLVTFPLQSYPQIWREVTGRISLRTMAKGLAVFHMVKNLILAFLLFLFCRWHVLLKLGYREDPTGLNDEFPIFGTLISWIWFLLDMSMAISLYRSAELGNIRRSSKVKQYLLISSIFFGFILFCLLLPMGDKHWPNIALITFFFLLYSANYAVVKILRKGDKVTTVVFV